VVTFSVDYLNPKSRCVLLIAVVHLNLDDFYLYGKLSSSSTRIAYYQPPNTPSEGVMDQKLPTASVRNEVVSATTALGPQF
jgi:hypothetical protein